MLVSRSSLLRKLRIVRWIAHGKSMEEAELLMGIQKGQARRDINYLKDVFKATKMPQLIQKMNAAGLIYANDQEQLDFITTSFSKDWIDNHFKRAA